MCYTLYSVHFLKDMRDIMIQLVAGAYVLAIRFKAIKQDRRIERPEARGDHRLEVARGGAAKGGNDLSYIGDAPGHELSPFKWYAALMSFYTGPRHAESPFFMAKDRTRPYTMARDSYYIAIKYRDGLSELSEARNSYFVAIWTDSPPLFFIATQIGAAS